MGFNSGFKGLTNKEMYAMVKNPTTTETIRLNRLRWFGHVQRMEENAIKKVLYMNLETTRLRGRPRNRWQDEGRKDGRLVGGKGWKQRVYSFISIQPLGWFSSNQSPVRRPVWPWHAAS